MKLDNILTFPSFTDQRGTLTCVDSLVRLIPFDVKRVFWIYGVKNDVVRGEHAHKVCKEIVFAINGTVDVELTDASGTTRYTLDRPNKGLIIPEMCWCRFSDFSAGCVLLCFASEEYDASGYINSFNDFLLELNSVK
ncbi:MAG: FdtA/QdtA family cupin domain-containing protein [Alloprevotella sp.]|nr:FdtA/QdtA family cupin domain-containing protein [Alloprevotella sp.]